MKQDQALPVEDEIFGKVISTYTRAEAIEDGGLIDITAQAKEAGFKFPVAITAEAFALVTPNKTAKKYGQDLPGRLWDVFTMLRDGIRRSRDGQQVNFVVLFYNSHRGHTRQEFKSIVSGGDNGEPVITIMLPNQD